MTTTIEWIISGISQNIGELWDLNPVFLIFGIFMGFLVFVSSMYCLASGRVEAIGIIHILAIVSGLFIYPQMELFTYSIIILASSAICLILTLLLCILGDIFYHVGLYLIKILKKWRSKT